MRDTALKRLPDLPAAYAKALAMVRKSQDATLRQTLAQELQRQPRVKFAVAVLADLAVDRKAPQLDRKRSLARRAAKVLILRSIRPPRRAL